MTDDEEFAQGFIKQGRGHGHDNERIMDLAMIALSFGIISDPQYWAIDNLLNEVPA